MVIRVLLLLALALTEPFHLAPIKALAIEQTGRSEHTDEYATQICKSYSLKPAQVRWFFAHAATVESSIHTHDRYSPCYVTGDVELTDGSKAQWKIHSGGTGILKFQDGHAVVLYCKACRWKDPFAGNYSPRSD